MKLQCVPVGLPELSPRQLQLQHLAWVRTQDSEWGLLRKENLGLYRGRAYDAEVYAVIRTVPQEDDVHYVGFVAGHQVTTGSDDLLATKLQVEQSITS